MAPLVLNLSAHIPLFVVIVKKLIWGQLKPLFPSLTTSLPYFLLSWCLRIHYAVEWKKHVYVTSTTEVRERKLSSQSDVYPVTPKLNYSSFMISSHELQFYTINRQKKVAPPLSRLTRASTPPSPPPPLPKKTNSHIPISMNRNSMALNTVGLALHTPTPNYH